MLSEHCMREGRITEAFQRVKVERLSGQKVIYVAVCDWQPDWRGTFVCFELEGGRIKWVAQPAKEPGEQSILTARGISLEGWKNPLIEVYGVTHMGHGNYYLYELAGRKLNLVLTTFAVDWHEDENMIQNGVLHVEYWDMNSDGFADIVFTGTVNEYVETEAGDMELDKSYPCRKVFLWNAGKKEFSPDRSDSYGFQSYPGRD